MTTRLLLAMSVYSLGVALLYGTFSVVYHWKIRQSDDILYLFVHQFDDYRYIPTIVILGVGYILIFLYYWRLTFRYMKEIEDATAMIYKDLDSSVELSPMLSHFEYEINQMQMQMQNNIRAAKEAEQRKNDLVVYLAHDLKTPLTSVIGYLSLLHDEREISEELKQKYMNIALDKSLRLEDLINEFFEITRFNLTTLTLEKSTINLSRLFEQLVYEFKPMLDEKQLDCELCMASNIKVKCDVGKLQRVFDNLLRNAVNYSFTNSKIIIDVAQSGKEIHVHMQNSGNTIPPEKLGRLFEQFYRLDSSRGTSNGGAGLGLAIAKEIVELHGGTIRVESADDTIEFFVSLPILEVENPS